jgi:hypothetical protein
MSDNTPTSYALVVNSFDRSKPAVFEGSVRDVRDWVLENTRPSDHGQYKIYMQDIMTYMSIPQFLERTKLMGAKIEDINNAIAFRGLSEKIPGGENSEKPVYFNETSEMKAYEEASVAWRTFEKNPAGEKSEKVNHPSHYNTGKIEVIDAIEDWKLGFILGNAIKYIARAEHKGNNVEDLEKAVWYINREIQRLKGAVQEETVEKKPACRIGRFDTVSGFTMNGLVKLSSDQKDQLNCLADEARQLGRRYAIMVVLKDEGAFSMWLTTEYPYGEIWMVDQR